MIKRDISENMHSIFFNGCGLLFPYYIGVVKSLEEQGYLRNARYGGLSSGSIVASLLALNFSYKEFKQIGIEMTALKKSQFSRNKFVFKSCGSYFDDFLKLVHHSLLIKFKSQESLDIACRNLTNLYIRVTVVESTFKWRELIIHSFEDFHDLITVVKGSCNIVPFFYGFKTIKWRNKRLIDGGFSSDSSIFGGPSSLSISPIQSKMDIHPKPTYSIIKCIIPYQRSTHIIEQGYHDTNTFIHPAKPKKRKRVRMSCKQWIENFLTWEIYHIIQVIFYSLLILKDISCKKFSKRN